MNRYQKLISNTGIFAIGNFGSKFLQFLLVPVYTHFLSRSSFGTVDLLSTTVSMLLPLVSLSVFDAVFRFSMDSSIPHKKTFTNGTIIVIILLALCTSLIPLFNLFGIPYGKLVYLLLSANIINSLFQNFIKAIGKSKSFAISGILNTIFTATANIYFIYINNLTVYTYLVSMLLGIGFSIVYLIFKLNIKRNFSLNHLDFSYSKKLLRYSIPLIPNALSWWLTSDATRFFILFFVGVSGNGLYAVANKIPSLLTMVFSVFSQSWQISAVEEYNSIDNDKYYTKIFNALAVLLIIATACLLTVLKPLMKIMVSPLFFESWHFVPFLLLSVMYSNLSAFLGTTYIASKKTVGLMTTTIMGTVANIFLNFLLVPLFGIQGAVMGGAIGFLLVLTIRIKNTAKFIKINVDWNKIIGGHIILVIMILLEFLIVNVYILTLFEFILLSILLFINKSYINTILSPVYSKIKFLNRM